MVLLAAVATALDFDGNPGSIRKDSHRVHELDFFNELNELENIPANPTAETLEHAAFRVDVERGGLFIGVEWAQSNPPPPASLQRNVFTDQLDQISTLADLFFC